MRLFFQMKGPPVRLYRQAGLSFPTANAAGGGIFGLIGNVNGRAAGLIERRQERTRWEHEARMLDAQMRAK